MFKSCIRDWSNYARWDEILARLRLKFMVRNVHMFLSSLGITEDWRTVLTGARGRGSFAWYSWALSVWFRRWGCCGRRRFNLQNGVRWPRCNCRCACGPVRSRVEVYLRWYECEHSNIPITILTYVYTPRTYIHMIVSVNSLDIHNIRSSLDQSRHMYVCTIFQFHFKIKSIPTCLHILVYKIK